VINSDIEKAGSFDPKKLVIYVNVNGLLKAKSSKILILMTMILYQINELKRSY